MSLARRFSNVLFAIGQAAVPALGYAGLYGKTIDAEFQVIKTPVVPADYAFIIWSPIFLFCLLYAVDQARPSRAEDPVYRRIGWLTAAAFAANMVWALVAQQEGPLLVTALVFLVTFVAMMVAVVRVFGPPSEQSSLLAKLAVGTLAGWVSVAIYANWSVALQDLGLADVPGREAQAIVLLSAAGSTAAAIVARTHGALVYVLTIIWALSAVATANVQSDTPAVAIGAALWAGGIVVLAGAIWWRRAARRAAAA